MQCRSKGVAGSFALSAFRSSSEKSRQHPSSEESTRKDIVRLLPAENHILYTFDLHGVDWSIVGKDLPFKGTAVTAHMILLDDLKGRS